MELYMIHYVKYQSDGREYHSRNRYIFGKHDAAEHYEKIFHWLHKLYCDDVISDYNIGMREICFVDKGFSDCEREYCENDISTLSDVYAEL